MILSYFTANRLNFRMTRNCPEVGLLEVEA
jgi:hypothetical protein